MKKLLLSLVFLMVGAFSPAAFAAECTLYEQSHPAFTLNGAHLSTGKCSTCASCHKQGIFTGTPKACITCHNGDPRWATIGRPATHVPTLLVECNSCHVTSGFAAYTMQHSAVSASRCDSCHNATYDAQGARKKPTDHVPTTSDCMTCHKTTTWDVNHAAIHAGVVSGCVTCHNGSYAVGKSSYAAHPVTSDNCETCHSTDAQFKCASIYDQLRNYASMTYNKALYVVKTFFA